MKIEEMTVHGAKINFLFSSQFVNSKVAKVKSSCTMGINTLAKGMLIFLL
jgi:hypothetical protein